MRPTTSRAQKASPPQQEQEASESSRLVGERDQSIDNKSCGAMAFQTLNSDLSLIITSWLSSYVTTHLRAASRACKMIFSRNCPSATTTNYVILEHVAVPWLRHRFELPRLNPHSPLRRWRIHLSEAAIAATLRNNSPRLARMLFNDRAFVLAAVAKDGRALEYADERFKSDRDVVLAAVARNGYALAHADPSLKSDRDFVLAAVAKCGVALKYANDDLRSDRDVVLAAVAQTGLALQYADGDLRSDRDVVLAAVAKDGDALQYANYDLRSDRDVVLAAVAQNIHALTYAESRRGNSGHRERA